MPPENRNPRDEFERVVGLSRVQKATVFLRQLLGLFLATGLAGLGLASLWVILKFVLWIIRIF